jgi:hypothetical protein
MSEITTSLEALRATWAKQQEALRGILSGIDTRGLRRPARDPEEREWLAARGEIRFIEDEEMGRAARAYYERKYRRP